MKLLPLRLLALLLSLLLALGLSTPALAQESIEAPGIALAQEEEHEDPEGPAEPEQPSKPSFFERLKAFYYKLPPLLQKTLAIITAIVTLPLQIIMFCFMLCLIGLIALGFMIAPFSIVLMPVFFLFIYGISNLFS